MARAVRRRWRDYRTAAGKRPVKEFIMSLSDEDRAAVSIAMGEVRLEGLSAARHLRRDIYEVRATGAQEEFRILFATEGKLSQVLLSLEAFSKKTRKTPPPKIELAAQRLADWRRRSRKA